jgi:uncharacterized protein YndB with AHSA1/START domain
MPSSICTRRDFSVRLAAFFPAIGFSGAAFGFACRPRTSPPAATDEISHSCEAIHQEVVFKASRKRVYDALTDAKQFNKVIQLSAAVSSGMVPATAKPAEITPEPGGAFSIYGGYITGRQIELVLGERIVQAWRTARWSPGVYSVAKYELTEEGTSTKLVFDHTGFPNGDADHLAQGWHGNYWEPLAKFLA